MRTARWRRLFLCLAPLAAAAGLMSAAVHGQAGTTNGEWRTFGGDLGSTRYAPLDQITAANFNTLEPAWRFRTDMLGARPDFNLQATPLMVGGVLYTTAGSRRDAVAIDAATGELLWLYRPDEDPQRVAASPRPLSGRGVAYWTDGRGDARIFFITVGYQLVALDARSGRPVESFGRRGVLDLKQQLDQEIDLITGEIGVNTAPVVARDVVIVGAAHRAGGAPRSKANVKGHVRGFDVRTGKRLWIFHTVPEPGQVGAETWQDDSWAYTGNTGMWAPFSVDEELGLAYLPIESPTGDYYGGHRPGDNLFGESLVAVDIQTGERRWHYQLVHHPIWDYDIPCAPILADIVVNGRPIKAVAQPTKQGFLFVFDRETGKPVWPIEERPVPQSKVPGERTSPTQPFPSRPAPFERAGFLPDYLIDFTPALRAEALEIASKYKLGPVYTPLIGPGEDGKDGLLMIPNGANWPGGSYDPETGLLYVFSHALTRAIRLGNNPQRSDMNFIMIGGGGDIGGGLTVQGLPLIKPPYGQISAINLNTGDIVWQVPHGETPEALRDHPALRGLDIPKTGRTGPLGTLTTKTLVISGESGFSTLPSGQRGARLFAYDKATGAVVGTVFMPAPQTGTPMTYVVNGKQYLVLAVGGGTYPAEILAYALPS
jgi:quinoprotein glucose dehydrogenase